MIKADMKIDIWDSIGFSVTINYLGKTCRIVVNTDKLDILDGSKQLIKLTYGKKKYRQIRDDVLNYVKQYMENKDDNKSIKV